MFGIFTRSAMRYYAPAVNHCLCTLIKIEFMRCDMNCEIILNIYVFQQDNSGATPLYYSGKKLKNIYFFLLIIFFYLC